MKHDAYRALIIEKAKGLGFFHVGFSSANFLSEEAPRLEQWLSDNYNGKMAYMANHFDKRLDPRKLEPGTKTIISLLLNYFPNKTQEDPNAPLIAKYAYGKDYHFVIKEKLKSLLTELREHIGNIQGRAFVDSAPVMDKVWAKKAGLGWIGKNTNLIQPQNGSFFFIAELFVDLEISPDGPIKDYCGTCTRCIDACPTDALSTPYVIDSRKCISYLTIELKDADLPSAFKGKMENWAFGCDICQDVCPWNRFSKAHEEKAFEPHPEFLNLSAQDWEQLTEDTFNGLFGKSPLKRTKFNGMKRNIQFLKKDH